MTPGSESLLLFGDLVGVAVFAASGASAAIAKELDLFGVIFVGFVAALGGGIFRDLVINDVPPLAFADWRYPATAAIASLLVFRFHPQVGRLRRTVLVLDAAGLALFTVTGTLKALGFGTPAAGAVLLGMFTGIGGGVARDLLLREIPVVLRAEIYAVASLLGAVIVVALRTSGWHNPATFTGAAALIFVLRLTALYRRWSAPRARPERPPTQGAAS